MPIERITLERFTAFESLEFKPSPGLNVLIGANGTGKTHLMKAAYAACDVSKTEDKFAGKLVRVFMPSAWRIGRLVNRKVGRRGCSVSVRRDGLELGVAFSHLTKTPDRATVAGAGEWYESPVECVYVPAKDMLANAPGFHSLYRSRELHFEEIYADILDRAFRPLPRGPVSAREKRLLAELQKHIGGRVTCSGEEFFLRNARENLEFALLAEGMRKLGLLWLLIRNGTLIDGSILFWDEPEANLNPKLHGAAIDIVLKLQRAGVQIFIVTHDYGILKELDLRAKSQDRIACHALSLQRTGERGYSLPRHRYLSRNPPEPNRRGARQHVRPQSYAELGGYRQCSS